MLRPRQDLEPPYFCCLARYACRAPRQVTSRMRHYRRGSICTVPVMPAASTTPLGTSSIWMRTGMRWASRTQVKIGLTLAKPWPLGIRDVDGARDAVDVAADDRRVAHQLDAGRSALAYPRQRGFLE